MEERGHITGRLAGSLTRSLTQEERETIVSDISLLLSRDDNIRFAFLYGSFLETGFFRDVDIAVYVQDAPLSDLWDYEFDISQEIRKGLSFPLEVDVKIINHAPLPFRFNVVKGQLLICKDEELLENFVMCTARSYLDMLSLRRRYLIEAMS